EYPASAVEKRPKFHFLFPHIAVLTGIAWDHINVFPTFDFYLEQFTIFINKIEKGGHLIYNETDETLRNMVEKSKRNDIHYHPYKVPQHRIENGVTSVVIDGVVTELKVFGAHNLLNLHAAWLVCKQLGVDAQTFANAIRTFTGAAKRLELLAKNSSTVFYRDFAHAPSKVKATIDAAKAQFPDRKLIGVLELHTYSSLNEAFMQEYKGALDKADEAAVFYSKHALELKRMPELKKEAVQNGFAKQGLEVMTDREHLESWIKSRDFADAVVLFMSSGNYDGFDVAAFAGTIAANNE
ncbi:MAG TPA: Mur ligase family protein, partial [Flavisolibacter sp.]|nr:Mur ligase family protein [Flavisolibacter sp.]